ncbi:MAG TPA: 6,7-dimethyl-8-ribityllumazine synthase [Tepidisphaeraceae bacterium]|jgi:6,7-dimethyl-8-ribityllumazine synthase
MSTQHPIAVPVDLPPGVRVGVVAARFNAEIVDELLRGCAARLQERGVATADIDVHRVPGAFELPVIAKLLATHADVAAVVCLGCVVRGDTPHFDYVAGETARGIMQVSIDTGVPVIFGVLTTNTQQQALDRAGGVHSHAGVNAADAAVEMIALAMKIVA